jgi:Ca-activated chloride channel family protein
LEPSGLRFEPDSIVPSRLPDLFTGIPLFLFGRYQGEAKGGLTLQAADELGQPWTQTLAAKRTDNAALTVLWARGQLRELEDRYACGHDDATELSKQIVATSLKYGVLCRFTAFVAVDRSETVNAGGQQHRIIQPVEMPARWEMPVACFGFAPGAALGASALRARAAASEVASVDSGLLGAQAKKTGPRTSSIGGSTLPKESVHEGSVSTGAVADSLLGLGSAPLLRHYL